MNARVEIKKREDGVNFVVNGAGRTIQAIQRMTTAHVRSTDLPEAWRFQVEQLEDGAVLAVSADESAEIEKISALSFIGILTLGAHHHTHHLMMAMGEHVH